MSKNIVTTAEATVYVNGEPAAKVLQDLRKDALNLRSALAQAVAAGDTSKAKKLQKDLRQTQREIREIESAAQSVEIVMRRLDKATPRELNLALKQLNKELNGMERGSAAWDAQCEKIKRVKAELESVRAETQRNLSAWERFTGR